MDLRTNGSLCPSPGPPALTPGVTVSIYVLYPTLCPQPLQLTEFQLPRISVLLRALLSHHFLH